MRKILLVEDDIQLHTTIKLFLESLQYSITSIFDGVDAISTIDENQYDLYIIDINIPNINGLEILKYIRKKDTLTPIIIITASLELSNLKNAFADGCNEYIKKPFYLEELEIRINNLMSNSTTKTIQISDTITYDMDFEELCIESEIVKLRKKERRLLTLLLQNINHTVTTEKIEEYVWENEVRESYPIRQLVADLRKKFNNGQKFIFADSGIGYRFEIHS
jgi:DNA-binding response OmpR family regulator